MTPKSKSRVAEYEDVLQTAEHTLREIVNREEKGLVYEERDALIRAANATREARKELARAQMGGPMDDGGC